MSTLSSEAEVEFILKCKNDLGLEMMMDLWKEGNPEGTLPTLIQVTSRTIYGGT